MYSVYNIIIYKIVSIEYSSKGYNQISVHIAHSFDYQSDITHTARHMNETTNQNGNFTQILTYKNTGGSDAYCFILWCSITYKLFKN